jgi:hypothetical protein
MDAGALPERSVRNISGHGIVKTGEGSRSFLLSGIEERRIG